MILGMVLIGGLTRLTGSGLSIVEWKPVTGILPPLTKTEWILEFSKYQNSPEFQKINFAMTIDDFKSIFFLEYIHRLWGRLIGFVLLIPTFLMIFKRQHRELLPLLALLWGLGLAQGVMGWVMVKSGLCHDPHVSPYRLSAHLFLGFMIFGVALWMTLRVFYYPLSEKKDLASPFILRLRHCVPTLRTNGTEAIQSTVRPERRYPELSEGNRSRRINGAEGSLIPLKRPTLIALSLVLLTAFFGALVAGLKAGLVYNTFPLMGNAIIPREFLTQSPWWKDLFENPVSVQFLHRCCAIITVIFCGGLWGYQRKLNLSPALITGFNAMFIAVLLQFTLGLLTLLFIVPPYLALLHQGFAFFVFGSLVYAIFLLNINAELTHALSHPAITYNLCR